MDDSDVWRNRPDLRMWFNKLYVANEMHYNCGPCGVSPDQSGYYIVRPIYNLSGMGVGARKCYIEAGDTSVVKPGYFWCEYFEGSQYSVTYSLDMSDGWPKYVQQSCWKATRDETNLYRFFKWERQDLYIPLPQMLVRELEFSNVEFINVEYIDTKPFEVHFRNTPDPDYNELIPIWEDDDPGSIDFYKDQGYTWIEARDNADGFLPNCRLGFMVK